MADQTGTCYSCQKNSHLASARPDQAIIARDGWLVAHAFNSALLGWLVVLPLRHVESFHELSQSEGRALGELARSVSAALVDVTGGAKTYAVMFAEAPGFGHLHVHLIPRHSSLPEDRQGTRVFEYLRRPEAEWIRPDARAELALRLRASSALGDREPASDT